MGPTGNGAPTAAGNGASTGTQADLERAARDSFTAFLTGDDQGHFDLLSRECRARLGFAAVESHLVGRRSRAQDLGGIDLSAVAISSVEIAQFSGSSGEVSLVLSGTDEPFRESEARRWEHGEGGWRLADCGDIDESPNSFEGAGTDRSDPLTLGAITDIAGWMVALTHVQKDFESSMSEGEVEPAAEGNQLVSAQLLVGYNGAEPSVVIGEHLAFAIVSDSDVYGDEAACISNEYDDLFYDPTMQATPGEDLPRPMICREVPTTDLGSLLLRATHIRTGTEYWFDLSGS